MTGLVENYDCQIHPATESEQNVLGLSDAAQVFRCTRVRHFNGRKFMYETVTIPQLLMPQLTAEDFSNPRVTFLGAQRHNMLIGNASERVDIALANDVMANALGIPLNKPLLRLDRVLYGHSGKRLEWRVAYCDLQDKYYMADMG